MRKQSAQSVAYTVAKHALLLCQTSIGIVPGTHHFVDMWGRDSLFASFGATVAGLAQLSKRTIEAFLSFQRSDGLIPYRIMRTKSTIAKYLGHPEYIARPASSFRSHQSGGIIPDGGLMTIIAAGEYIATVGSVSDAKNWYPSLAAAILWYERHFGQGRLIREWFLCEWTDSVLKVGQTLYTNVLYYKALVVVADIAKRLHQTSQVETYNTLASSVRGEIVRKFWNGKYFSDWVDWRRQDFFATYANMLTILWGVASNVHATSILGFSRAHAVNSFTLETNTPSYPFWRIPLHHHLLGMADYHNTGCLWLQPGILYALALDTIGAKKKSRAFFRIISEKIAAEGVVSEVYDRKTGTPLKRRFYASEQPFAWSAGLYLWAAHQLNCV